MENKRKKFSVTENFLIPDVECPQGEKKIEVIKMNLYLAVPYLSRFAEVQSETKCTLDVSTWKYLFMSTKL